MCVCRCAVVTGYDVACFHPLPAWRLANGVVTLRRFIGQADGSALLLPCGGCLGCRFSRAREWALRCSLELSQHDAAAFVTLTYDTEHVPVTLSVRHLQLFFKRLRRSVGDTPLRFFASGEYGDKFGRPHYHALVFGLPESSAGVVSDVWPRGAVHVGSVTPESVSYVAGYVSKKVGYREVSEERIDYATGEVYQYQPPFVRMSRRPGIGAYARDTHWRSWRDHAVYSGRAVPVPRFLHEGWKSRVSDRQLEILQCEREVRPRRDVSRARLDAAEAIAESRLSISLSRRSS